MIIKFCHVINIMDDQVIIKVGFITLWLADWTVPSQVLLGQVAAIGGKTSNKNIFDEKVGKVE